MSCLYNNAGSSCTSAFTRCASCPQHAGSLGNSSGAKGSSGEPVKEWLQDVGKGIGGVFEGGQKKPIKPKKKPSPNPASQSGDVSFNPLKSLGSIAFIFGAIAFFSGEDDEQTHQSRTSKSKTRTVEIVENLPTLVRRTAEYGSMPTPWDQRNYDGTRNTEKFVQVHENDKYVYFYTGPTNFWGPHGYGRLFVYQKSENGELDPLNNMGLPQKLGESIESMPDMIYEGRFEDGEKVGYGFTYLLKDQEIHAFEGGYEGSHIAQYWPDFNVRVHRSDLLIMAVKITDKNEISPEGVVCSRKFHEAYSDGKIAFIERGVDCPF